MRKFSDKHRCHLIRKSRHFQPRRKFALNLLTTIEALFQNFDYPYEVKSRTLEFSAPRTMDLAEHYDETVRFLKVLRNSASLGMRRMNVHFTSIQRISPLVALLLTSEVHRWQLRRGPLRIIDQELWKPSVKRLLHEMGFFKLVQTINKAEVEADKPLPIEFARFRSGHLTMGKTADDLRIDLEKMAGPINAKSLMYGGLTEAMKNVLHWAYNSETPGALRRWWMSGSYHHDEKRMTIMIYDHGVGIPATLPKSSLWERINGVFESNDDSAMIKAAMQVGRSATNQSYRGKGLADIQKFILESGGGVLRVLSGKGEYSITSRGIEKVVERETRLDGTLIAWEIYDNKESVQDV